MYEMDGRVRYSEVDSKGNLTIAALIDYLQDSCTFQGEDLGFTLDYLREHSWGWYITNWQIDLKTLPKLGDRILIKTWPHRFRGMLGYRNFVLENEAGETLVQANSIWILMNLDNMHPVRIPQEMLDAYVTSPPIEKDWGDRKIRPAAGYEEIKTVVVEPLHLDTNMHMNNEHYIEIARDVLPPGTKIYEIATEYRKQAVLGDELRIRRAKKADDRWQIALAGEGERNVYAMVEFVTDK